MATSRLSADDWVGAGLRLLAEDGLPALKIDTLCSGLGVTKGSFYWHFDDLGAFLAAVRDEWTQTRAAQREAEEGSRERLSPRARLDAMMELAIDPHEIELEKAMREWARSDALVRGQVAEWDAWVLAELRQAFADLGFTGDARETRASTLFLAGLGYVHAVRRDAAPSKAQRTALLDLLTAR